MHCVATGIQIFWHANIYQRLHRRLVRSLVIVK